MAVEAKWYRSLSRVLIVWSALVVGCLASADTRAGVLSLRPVERDFTTSGLLERLDDPDGHWTAVRAASAGPWTPVPGNLNAGFTDSAVWLRLSLQVETSVQGGWVLRFGNALLDDVQVYVQFPGEENWHLLGHGGEDVPRVEWPVDYRSPVFTFAPARPGLYPVLVRLKSKNAMVTRLDVWQRLAFDNQSRREGLLFGLYFGVYLLLICIHAVFWGVTRAAMSGLFLAYIGLCVFNEVLSLGLVQQITGLSVVWSDRLLGVGIACSLPVALQIAFRYLALQKVYPRVARGVLRAAWAVAAVASVLVCGGWYGMGMQPVQILALLSILGCWCLALWLWWRGHAPARYFLPVFGLFYGAVLVSFLRNLGHLPVNAWTEYASTLGTMLHMGALSLIVVGRHEVRRRARERQQAHAAAELARGHSERLQHEVALRTAELRAEIQRRGALEEELREALALERKVRAEQRDFVAMVSHEFRTPLAIISTSAQQLARNLAAPVEKSVARCRNIRDAAQRLLALVDEYLTDDRMREAPATLRLVNCDLRALLQDLAQEFASGRIVWNVRVQAEHLFSDPSLLRIALRNLLANADRHAPAEAVVQVRAEVAEGFLLMEVANPGVPILEEDRIRLFQKYHRGQNALGRPGAGLGLYLVRNIAERLGGDVELVSLKEEVVTCFRLRLPLSGPDVTGG